ncbi:Serine/threonine-protein kinase ArnS [Metallosphaera sp. J1]|uniref:protein kinase domain-containing protein n=1 Tax=Metallosphaera javensis (ex Hofmann et al. 2022) TaxID=99938 RepID=UPI001EDD22D3|nr:protein kinase [Metallosphaera javensis (ex Hofmann et al. 2022)]MCG3108746.1 Serine/threonine-protein kinase ArnS [Metallosphaera javensis (ex Hofmann et al. 2022)]
MKFSYGLLAKWSSALKIAGSLEALAIAFLYFYRGAGVNLNGITPLLTAGLPLLFILFISLASVLKHSMKAYGLATSLWLGLTLIALNLEKQGGELGTVTGYALSFLTALILLIASIVLFTHRGRWKTFVFSFLLYIIVVLPLISYLFLGNQFISLLVSLSGGNLSVIPDTLISELHSSTGLISVFLSSMGLAGLLMLSYSPDTKPYQALRSVGLTYPSIPVLGSLWLLAFSYTLGGGFSTSLLVLAGASLVLIPISLFPRFRVNPVPLGLFTSTASLALGALLFLLSPGYALLSLLLTGAGGSVIPRGLTDPDKVKARLVESVKLKRYSTAKRYVSFLNSLGISPSSLACQFSRDKNCTVLLWLISNYNVDYGSCQDLKGFVQCILSSGNLPNNVDPLLLTLEKRDRENAEKLAGLVLAKGTSEKTRETARRIISPATAPPQQEKLNLPPLSQWDPSVWVNREIYGYQVKKVVGKGGTAYVLLAERGGQSYAIKIPFISPASLGERTRLSKTTFADMAGESSKLQEISTKTEDMVTLYGIFVDRTAITEILSGKVEVYLKSPPAMVMEFMGGGDVDSLLKEQAVFYSEKWERIVTFILMRVARALNVVHSEGYVHLDVKTKNIFFSSPPGRSGDEVMGNLITGRVKAKLGDLGASKKIGAVLDQYTAEYCPVDQVQALLLRSGANPKMDIYALGATGYKMLTGQILNPPEVVKLMDGAVDEYLNRGNFSSMLDQASREYQRFYASLSLSGVDPELANVIKAMINPDPGRRPTAGQVATTLERIFNRMNR